MTPCLVCNAPVPPQRAIRGAVTCGEACQAARKRERERRYYQQTLERAATDAAAAAQLAQAQRSRVERRRRRRWERGEALGRVVAEEVLRRIQAYGMVRRS